MLAEALGKLPLALDHAAADCKRTQMSFAHFAVKASRLIAAALRGAGYPGVLPRRLTSPLAKREASSRQANHSWRTLAQRSPERIPIHTGRREAVDDEVQRLQAFAALADASLVEHDPFEDNTPAVTVHRLVQMVARARLWDRRFFSA